MYDYQDEVLELQNLSEVEAGTEPMLFLSTWSFWCSPRSTASVAC